MSSMMVDHYNIVVTEIKKKLGREFEWNWDVEGRIKNYLTIKIVSKIPNKIQWIVF